MTAPVLTGTGSSFVTGTGASHVTQRGDDRIPTCVEIGYNNPSTFGIPNGQWVDVTTNVMSLSTTRGRSQELQRFEAGTLSMRLDNRSGNYSVWIGSGATIGCPIRVRISAEKSDPTGSSPSQSVYDPTDGGFYYVFTGYITGLTYGWSPGGVGGAWCDIQAADAFVLLNRAELSSQTFADNIATTQAGSPSDGVGFVYADDRVNGVLDVSGVKQLFGGSYIVRATWSHFGDPEPFSPLLVSGVSNPVTGNALQHLGDIADAGFTDLYMRPDNLLAWRPFSEIRNQAFDGTTIFGDNVPTEIPYASAAPTYDDQNLYNDISITTFGPSTFSASDQTSMQTYGRRVYSKTFDVVESGIATVGPDDYLTRYTAPIVHVPSITVSLRACTDAQRMRVLSLPIGYRVEVIRRPAGGDTLTAECYFEGASLAWEPGMVEVRATLNLAPVRPVNAFVDPIPT